jgi:hypothetical protein
MNLKLAPWTGALFSASSSTTIGISTNASDGQYILGLIGTRVDTIARLGAAWEPIVDIPFDRERAQRLIDEVETFCNQSPLLSSPEQILDAKTRILCADQAAYGGQRSRASTSILREEY